MMMIIIMIIIIIVMIIIIQSLMFHVSGSNCSHVLIQNKKHSVWTKLFFHTINS